MRSALLILLAGLTFATTPARAQSAWLERDMVTAVCSREATPAAGERLARRLNLTDVQKSALKDMTDAFASANASAKKSLCSDKPDLSTVPGRAAFAEQARCGVDGLGDRRHLRGRVYAAAPRAAVDLH
jgi:hypothetical protein